MAWRAFSVQSRRLSMGTPVCHPALRILPSMGTPVCHPAPINVKRPAAQSHHGPQLTNKNVTPDTIKTCHNHPDPGSRHFQTRRLTNKRHHSCCGLVLFSRWLFPRQQMAPTFPTDRFDGIDVHKIA